MSSRIWLWWVVLYACLNFLVLLQLSSYFKETALPQEYKASVLDKEDLGPNTMTSPNTELLDSDLHKPKGQRILLLSSYRSGSSFIGEILHHQENTFYSFEPLKFFTLPKKRKGRINTSFVSKNGSEYLRDIFSCDFERLEKDSTRYTPATAKSRQDWISRCFMGIKTFNEAQTVCRANDNVVIKTVRVAHLQKVFHLMEQGIKIIHLIRDPRAVVLSRCLVKYGQNCQKMLQSKKGESFVGNMSYHHCVSLKSNLDYIINLSQLQPSQNSTLYRNYVLIRFEDVAYSPEPMARKLVTFVQTTPEHDFFSWLVQVTQNASPRRNVYGIERNSKEVAGKWRKILPYSLVKVIQAKCDSVLEASGYQLVNSQAELTSATVTLVSEIAFNIPHI